MSSPVDQVRVRLTAEGISEVVSALKTVQRESANTGSAVSRAFTGIKSLLPSLGFTAVVAGLVSVGRAAFNAADQMADTAKRIGVSAESLSRLAFAAKQNDVEFEELAAGIEKWQVTLSLASTGNKKATAALDLLGLKAKDLKDLKLEDQLALIADRFTQLQNPADRSRVAVKLFGDAGIALVPFLADGAKGIKALTEEADRLGITLRKSTVDGVDKLDDAVKRLKATLSGRVQSFLGQFSLAVLGTGDDTLDAMTKKIIDLTHLRQQLVAGGELVQGSPEAARLKQVEIELGNVIKSRQIYLDQLAAEKKAREDLIKSTQRTLPADPTTPTTPKFAPVSVHSPFEAKALIEEGDRILKEISDANQVVFDITQKTLDAQGRGKEAELAALDKEIEKYKEILLLSGKNADTVTRITSEYRSLAAAQIEVRDLTRKGSEQLDAIDRSRAQLEQDVQLGRVSEAEAKRRLLDIEKDRLAVAEQFVTANLAAAQASGNEQLIAQAEELKRRYDELLVVYKQNADGLAEIKTAARDALEEGVSNFLRDIRTGAKSVGDAFKDLADGILDSIFSVIENRLAQQFVNWFLGPVAGGGGVLGSLFGFKQGGLVKAADGGFIRGPGTSTSDSIPARLSNNEFVVRAKSAGEQPGAVAFLSAFNRGQITMAHIRSSLGAGLRSSSVGFAAGGPVSVATSPAAAAAAAPTIHQTIVAPNGTVPRQTLSQIATATRRGMDEAARRNS